MPCTMPTLTFDRSEQNERLKEIGDTLTHELDKIREAVLAGETPDFSAYDAEWVTVVNNAKFSLTTERGGPSDGVLTDARLLDTVVNLLNEYNFIKSEWRKDRCVTIMGMIHAGQVIHRQDDVKRLMHRFIEVGDTKRLRALLDAGINFDLPLEPQLGYDPDDF